MCINNKAIQKVVSQIQTKNEELGEILKELDQLKKELRLSWNEKVLKIYSEKSEKFLKICKENEDLLNKWVLLMRAETNVN